MKHSSQLVCQNNKFCFGFYVLFIQIHVQTLAQWCMPVEGFLLKFLYLQYFLTVHFCRFWRYLVNQAFKNVCTCCSWKFTTISNRSDSDHTLLSSSYTQNMIDSSSSRVSSKKPSFFRMWCIHFL